VFPTFDQPDLKASWQLSTIVPKEWTVVSNELATQENRQLQEEVVKTIVDVSQSFGASEILNSMRSPTVTIFKETPKIPTYLYAIVAGPYKHIELNEVGLPPMKVYLRDSLMKKADQNYLKEIMTVTKSGLNFYKDLFGKPFVFSKYDQVFAPEFASGAMENVGCVTINEDLLYIGEPLTLEKRKASFITIMHELAHHWFGNLVTMKWWNDLWLNESFATYISYMSISRAEDLHYLGSPWDDFVTRKFGGVRDDILNTTHPICSEIKNIESADSAFDGISYDKGASFLKQTHKLMGHERFKAALHKYFDRYQWKNTELKDFVGCLVEAYQEKRP